jgi:cytochrome c peroxidase
MKTIVQTFFFFFILYLILVQCRQGINNSVSPFKAMEYPKDNPATEAKIALGKKLFFDKRLSLNNEISCASCHTKKKALSDGRKLAKGVEGRLAFRNSPSLFNIGYSPVFMFDGEIKSLEEQVLVPILDHNEMGASMKEVIEKLRNDPAYQAAAQKIYQRDFDAWVLTRSIASYERTLISDNSNFDKYYYQNKANAISESAKRGWKLFSEKLNCIKCHSTPFFTDFKVHNNGRTALSDSDLGRFRIKNDSTMIGFFKAPSLRNISLTAPYMHDGSIATLEDVIEYYVKGGNGGYNQELRIKAFSISKEDKKDLINFLKSLQDF